MTGSSHTAKARLLLQQDNYTKAVEFARLALQENPQDADALTVLALALSSLEQKKEALQAARDAVGLAPDAPYTYLVLASVAHDQDDLKTALEAGETCIEMDPDEASAYGIVASVHSRRSNFKKAYEMSRQGLELDPDDEYCRNVHALTLSMLGRKEEASENLSRTLTDNPDSAMTHANLGWVRLQEGREREALECFREALRLDPDHGSARDGMIQAIKARNPIFKLFLAYAHWLARMSPGVRQGLIIGLVIGVQIVSRVGRTNPELEPFTTALVLGYIGFVYTTWTIDALFNVLLFFHPFGRHALNTYEKRITFGLAATICLGLAFVGLSIASYFVLEGETRLGQLLLYGGLCLVGMGIPVASLYRAERKDNRIILGIEVGVLILATFAAMFLTFLSWRAVGMFGYIGLALMLSTWLNSYLLGRER